MRLFPRPGVEILSSWGEGSWVRRPFLRRAGTAVALTYRDTLILHALLSIFPLSKAPNEEFSLCCLPLAGVWLPGLIGLSLCIWYVVRC